MFLSTCALFPLLLLTKSLHCTATWEVCLQCAMVAVKHILHLHSPVPQGVFQKPFSSRVNPTLDFPPSTIALATPHPPHFLQQIHQLLVPQACFSNPSLKFPFPISPAGLAVSLLASLCATAPLHGPPPARCHPLSSFRATWLRCSLTSPGHHLARTGCESKKQGCDSTFHT